MAIEYEQVIDGCDSEVGFDSDIVFNKLEDVGIVGERGSHHQKR